MVVQIATNNLHQNTLTQSFFAKMFSPSFQPQIYRDLQKDVDEMKKAREKKERTSKSDEKKKAFILRRSSD